VKSLNEILEHETMLDSYNDCHGLFYISKCDTKVIMILMKRE